MFTHNKLFMHDDVRWMFTRDHRVFISNVSFIFFFCSIAHNCFEYSNYSCHLVLCLQQNNECLCSFIYFLLIFPSAYLFLSFFPAYFYNYFYLIRSNFLLFIVVFRIFFSTFSVYFREKVWELFQVSDLVLVWPLSGVKHLGRRCVRAPH